MLIKQTFCQTHKERQYAEVLTRVWPPAGDNIEADIVFSDRSSVVVVQVQVPQGEVKRSSQRGKVHREGQAKEQANRQGDTCLAVWRAKLGRKLGAMSEC